MSPRIGLFDYGSGNLHSARRAFANAGADVVLTGDLDELAGCDGLVVPGVGAFATCMTGLSQAGGVELIRDWVASGRPLLGICVGHQVLFELGTEHGTSIAGLGIHRGTVSQLAARRLPHMGWNTVEAPDGSRLFAGVERSRFYFVHSYAATPVAGDGLVTTARHEDAVFVAALESGPVSSTQFHPEKSGAAGARLISNWLGQL
ncbi:imidazole glycerol phosphate synthase subunit HisH [Tessaracoccus lacteus]|uniref:Imidazole glycerol phosphate synthase subunit HisH n=1 Tax=Tessaracoccus lacteus TaxID=3041766 RepID=A0ABY8PU80_9ACTN|nr:imidazole glycerol phosphate synthase subunit HisH [Tessaracoccus sp. T21]WGT45991.1 imidazole glycerol phosphate synthase subunit HisH [Tessaracoccus sp. T21]